MRLVRSVDRVGKRHDAPGHAQPIQDAGHLFARLNQYKLRGATADIEDNGRTVTFFQQDVASQNREPGLFLG